MGVKGRKKFREQKEAEPKAFREARQEAEKEFKEDPGKKVPLEIYLTSKGYKSVGLRAGMKNRANKHSMFYATMEEWNKLFENY